MKKNNCENLVVGINELVPNDWNSNSESPYMYQKLKKSIEDEGQIDLISVYKPDDSDKYVIVGGYHRWLVMRELGYKKVDIRYIKNIDRYEAIKISNLLNIVKGEIDPERLSFNLKEMLHDGGYSMEEIEDSFTYSYEELEEILGIKQDDDIEDILDKEKPESIEEKQKVHKVKLELTEDQFDIFEEAFTKYEFSENVFDPNNIDFVIHLCDFYLKYKKNSERETRKKVINKRQAVK